MKTILVPVDFSSSSLNASNYALDLANSVNAELVLLHVFELLVFYPETFVDTVTEEQQRKEIELRLEELKLDLLHKSKSKLSIKTAVRSGEVVSGIKKYATEIDAFLIVMGSGGKSSLERFLWGSKTLSAIKRINAPVMIIPSGVRFTKIRKIAFACDLDELVEKLPLNEIKRIVGLFSADFHIINISKEYKHILSDSAREELKELRNELKELKPVFHYSYSEEIAVGIQEFTEKMNFDLVIIVPKTYSLIKELFHQRDSTSVVLHAHLPVLSIHE